MPSLSEYINDDWATYRSRIVFKSLPSVICELNSYRSKYNLTTFPTKTIKKKRSTNPNPHSNLNFLLMSCLNLYTFAIVRHNHI